MHLPAAFLALALSLPGSALDLEMLALEATLARFPTAEQCDYWLDRADRHLAWIAAQAPLYPRERFAWQEYRQQVEDWRGIWRLLRTCRTGRVIPQDRERLAQIRAAIGETAFRAGHVPPPIAPYFVDEGQQASSP